MVGTAADAHGNYGVELWLRLGPVPPLKADPSVGASVLRFDRGPYFTLLRECPAFTIGLLELGAARRQNP